MADTGVHNLASYEEYEKARDDNGDALVVVDCFATWCGPCKAMAPKFVELAKNFPSAKFYKVDIDEVGEVAAELSVRSLPSFFFFKNKKQVADMKGADAAKLTEMVNANI